MGAPHSHFLVLADLRSAYNVGAILRTADAVGINTVFICGNTPCPIDRFGRIVREIEKTALGAQNSVAWEYVQDARQCIETLKRANITVLALEQDSHSIDYREYEPDGDTALVLGSETDGVSPDVIAACDGCIEIPMRGKKESLNVSVAAGIAMYALFDQSKSRA